MLGQRPMSQPKVQQSEGVAASLGTVRTVRTVGWDISGPWAFCHQLYRPGLAEGQPGDGQPLLALGSCEAGVDVSATHAGEGPSSRWMQWVCPKYARPIARAFRWHCWGDARRCRSTRRRSATTYWRGVCLFPWRVSLEWDGRQFITDATPTGRKSRWWEKKVAEKAAREDVRERFGRTYRTRSRTRSGKEPDQKTSPRMSRVTSRVTSQ